MSPPTPKPGWGTLFHPPGPSLEWDEDMLATLERCVAEEWTVAETCRQVGVGRDSVARGFMILIWRYQRGRPV
jgi:hypothetical protein